MFRGTISASFRLATGILLPLTVGVWHGPRLMDFRQMAIMTSRNMIKSVFFLYQMRKGLSPIYSIQSGQYAIEKLPLHQNRRQGILRGIRARFLITIFSKTR